jgi:hypothetical protein
VKSFCEGLMGYRGANYAEDKKHRVVWQTPRLSLRNGKGASESPAFLWHPLPHCLDSGEPGTPTAMRHNLRHICPSRAATITRTVCIQERRAIRTEGNIHV